MQVVYNITYSVGENKILAVIPNTATVFIIKILFNYQIPHSVFK
jgi:hypothetical protein